MDQVRKVKEDADGSREWLQKMLGMEGQLEAKAGPVPSKALRVAPQRHIHPHAPPDEITHPKKHSRASCGWFDTPKFTTSPTEPRRGTSAAARPRLGTRPIAAITTSHHQASGSTAATARPSTVTTARPHRHVCCRHTPRACLCKGLGRSYCHCDSRASLAARRACPSSIHLRLAPGPTPHPQSTPQHIPTASGRSTHPGTASTRRPARHPADHNRRYRGQAQAAEGTQSRHGAA